ncbi:hypothetical protein BGZ83_011063 [Gryganskiella cystojenkinii]|nr:hypothetical protein BGZ83_011063 [Gryganskiella cystojenkinii]
MLSFTYASSTVTMIDTAGTGNGTTFTYFHNATTDIDKSKVVPVIKGAEPFLFFGNTVGNLSSMPLTGTNMGVFLPNIGKAQIPDSFGLTFSNYDGSSAPVPPTNHTGLIAGITAGAVVFLVVIACVVIRTRRKNRRAKATIVAQEVHDQKFLSNDQGAAIIEAAQLQGQQQQHPGQKISVQQELEQQFRFSSHPQPNVVTSLNNSINNNNISIAHNGDGPQSTYWEPKPFVPPPALN